jgi:hypothetical protein
MAEDSAARKAEGMAEMAVDSGEKAAETAEVDLVEKVVVEME